MPLHPASLFNNLRNEIENRSLEKVDQIILLDNLTNLVKEQSFQQITFFEFEDIFATLQKGSIDDTDYHKFGLFKDADLDKFNGKEQRDRLRENRDLFDYVRKVHDFGLNKEELEKQFSPEGANDSIKEEWRELPFSRVYKFNEDYRKLNKKKKVDLIGLKVNHTIKPWDKPYKESTSGKRKRHIIIFNHEGKEEIELQAFFSLEGNVKSISSEFLKVPNAFPKNLTVEVKQTNIFAKIKLEKDATTFTRFSYKHDHKAALGAEFLIAVLAVEPIYLDSYKSTYLIDPNGGHIEVQSEESELSFGNGMDIQKVEVTEDNQTIITSQDQKLVITPLPEAFNDEDELSLNIKFEE